MELDGTFVFRKANWKQKTRDRQQMLLPFGMYIMEARGLCFILFCFAVSIYGVRGIPSRRAVSSGHQSTDEDAVTRMTGDLIGCMRCSVSARQLRAS